MFGAVGRTAFAFRAAALFYLMFVFGRLLWNTAAPVIEEGLIQPVQFLHFDQRICVGDDAVVSGLLDKTKYPKVLGAGGEEAELLGLTFYDDKKPANRLAWRRVNENDKSPESRPYGEQTVAVFVYGGCAAVLTVTTRHKSPITGFVYTMTWGPFYPDPTPSPHAE